MQKKLAFFLLGAAIFTSSAWAATTVTATIVKTTARPEPGVPVIRVTYNLKGAKATGDFPRALLLMSLGEVILPKNFSAGCQPQQYGQINFSPFSDAMILQLGLEGKTCSDQDVTTLAKGPVEVKFDNVRTGTGDVAGTVLLHIQE